MNEFALSGFAIYAVVVTGILVGIALADSDRVTRSIVFGCATTMALVAIGTFIQQAVNYLAAVTP